MRVVSSLLLSALVVFPLALAQNARAEMELQGKGFDKEALAMFEASKKDNRGLTFYVDGQQIPGVVIEVSTDSVVVKNQNHARVVIRRDRIDAIGGL